MFIIDTKKGDKKVDDLSNEEKLLYAVMYGDEENPPIQPTEVKTEAWDRYEKAKELVYKLQETGAVNIITVDEKPARRFMEVWVEWQNDDQFYKADQVSEFISLFDYVGFADENAWVLKTHVYKGNQL